MCNSPRRCWPSRFAGPHLALRILVAGGLAISCGGGGPGVGGSTGVCAAAANVAWDSDGDGAPDSICVSDFDADGMLETDDVQNALLALGTATTRRTVTVLPGIYEPPPDPSAQPGRGRGLIEIGDDTTLQCQPGAVLRAPEATDEKNNYAVLANADHDAGNQNLVISGCEIDGGAPDGYVHSDYRVGARMGVYLRRTRNSLLENNFVHHTYHTGIYSSNSTGDILRANRIEDAGGYGNEAPWRQRIRYPCIYAFSFGGEPLLDFVAEDNEMLRCASSGLNTRADTANASGDVIRNLRWIGNRIQDTGNSTGDDGYDPPDGSSCIYVRGVDTALIADNECHSTGPVFLFNGASGYRSQGDDDANSNITLERLTITDVDSTSGVWIGKFVDGLTVRDIEVRGTRHDDGRPKNLSCFVIQPPYRNASFDRIRISECGGTGLKEAISNGSGATPEESLVIRDLNIEGTDLYAPLGGSTQPGIWFQSAHVGLLLEGVSISGTTGPGILFQKRLEQATLRDIQIDGVETGWLGHFAEADVPVCDPSREERWLTTSDGSSALDCDFAPGSTGVVPVRCGCQGGTWALVSTPGRSGIDLRADAQPSHDVWIGDVVVANMRDDTGIRIRGEVSEIVVDGLVGADTSHATDRDQNSAIEIPSVLSDVSLLNVTCVGTDPQVPCVEYASP